ncbi:Peptidoglycan/LPS O-acetylase OafA/YrhL, contains acyltransferase and SGNH-hydrolase domains [Collimonas sp. OK242]|uniref:acyltransferase family protein n=1 Tax=Collimonas sp. OK242 TaxID=1798195 RepID=UPI0008950C67|nr:acyltransferase [Collimonas sp. OK242]SDY44416.1 Peptidoglycan/LPS O-acetylase OafA/YrhL, contains acyltransferase and SGNH-hydrolase domains [Collimonas sp. OK242]
MDKTRIDAITGLRGLAALLVVYGHTVSWFSLPWKINFSGEIGVMVFFSLSGFLMAYLYLGKKFSALSVADYAISRFSRIAPAYLVILLFSFLIYTYIDPNFVYDISSKNILRHIFFSGNVSVFWSITPEVEFYFLFVLVWAAASRYVTRVDIAGLLFLTFGALIFLSYRDMFPGTFVGAKLHYFLFGVIAGIVRSRIGTANQDGKAILVLHALLLASMGLMEGGWIALPFASNKEFYSSILTAVFGSFLVFGFSFPSALGKFFFENKAIVLCGECSFSIYLLHMPIIYVCHKFLPSPSPLQMVLLIPFVVLVLGLSWLNFQLIEKPGARLIRFMGSAFKQKFIPLLPLATRPQPLSVESETR